MSIRRAGSAAYAELYPINSPGQGPTPGNKLDDKGALKQELTFDGLHPNDAGYEIMMPLAQRAIDQALK